jgi:hypothetical protein
MSKTLKLTAGTDTTDVPQEIKDQSNSVIAICVFMGILTAMAVVMFVYGIMRTRSGNTLKNYGGTRRE